MTCSAQSKWGDLLCSSAVTSYGLWQKPCVWGGGGWFIPTCQWTSLVAQRVEHLPTMWETRVQSLGWEDLLEKEMATHSSILAWKIPWMEEPGGLQSMGLQRVGHNWAVSLSLFTCMHWRRKWQPTPVFLPGESQGRGAWWTAVYGVAQSQTRLKLQQEQDVYTFQSSILTFKNEVAYCISK